MTFRTFLAPTRSIFTPLLLLAPLGCSSAENEDTDSDNPMTNDPTTIDGSSGGTTSSDGSGGSVDSTTGGSNGDPSGYTGGTSDGLGGGPLDGAEELSVPPIEIPCDETYEVNGREGCISTINGFPVGYFPKDRTDGRQFMRVYYTGDRPCASASNAVECYGEDFLKVEAQEISWLDQNQAIDVYPLPSKIQNGGSRWYANSASDEDLLGMANILRGIQVAFGIPTENPVLYWGLSGGSVYLSGWWLSRWGHVFPGPYALSCGGVIVKPEAPWRWEPSIRTDLRDLSPFHFQYGENDFLRAAIEETHTWISGQGFTATITMVPGAGHCGGIGIGDATRTHHESVMARFR